MSDDGEAVKLLNNLFKHLETGNPIPAGAHFHGLLRDFLARHDEDADIAKLRKHLELNGLTGDSMVALDRIAARLRDKPHVSVNLTGADYERGRKDEQEAILALRAEWTAGYQDPFIVSIRRGDHLE